MGIQECLYINDLGLGHVRLPIFTTLRAARHGAAFVTLLPRSDAAASCGVRVKPRRTASPAGLPFLPECGCRSDILFRRSPAAWRSSSPAGLPTLAPAPDHPCSSPR